MLAVVFDRRFRVSDCDLVLDWEFVGVVNPGGDVAAEGVVEGEAEVA